MRAAGVPIPGRRAGDAGGGRPRLPRRGFRRRRVGGIHDIVVVQYNVRWLTAGWPVIIVAGAGAGGITLDIARRPEICVSTNLFLRIDRADHPLPQNAGTFFFCIS